ncbi:MAG: hypothetical protein ABW003_28455, partial [Microvirga sp.]
MQVIKLLIASCILTTAGANLASAQFVDPFKVLEEAKRDRLELDKRLAREAAERRQKEKSEPAAKLNAQRKLDQHRPTAASATLPGASAEQAVTSQNPAPSPELRNPPAASGSTFDANETRPPAAPGILPVVASSPEPPESTTHRTPIPSSTTTPPTTADAPEVPLSAAIAPEPASPLPPASEHPPGTLPAGEDTKPAVAAPARVLITV